MKPWERDWSQQSPPSAVAAPAGKPWERNWSNPEPAAEEAPGLGQRLLTNAAEAFTSNPIQAADRALSRGVGSALGALGWEDNPSARRAAYHDQQRLDAAQAYEAMPSFTEEDGIANKAAAGAASLIGQLGGAAADPTSFIGAGAGTLARQFGIGAVTNAALDAPSQADDMRLGIQEGFDPLRSAAAGALGGTLSIAPGALRSLRDKWGTPRTQSMSDADFEAKLREEAALNPDIAADLRAAGVPDETVQGLDPAFAQQAAETLARRRAESQSQGIRPGEAGDNPEGADLRRSLRDQPRMRQERMAVDSGEMDPAAASTAGRRPPEDGPILADAEGNAYRQTPENEAGRAAALRTKAEADARAQRDFDLAYRSGDYRRARAIREAQWKAEDAELRRQEQESPTLRARGPGGDPVGPSSIVDPATARPLRQGSRVTGGTGDRPYVEPAASRDSPELSERLDADADGANAEFFRRRAESQAEDARLRDAETLEREWAQRAEREKARAEANQRARAKTERASGGRFDEDPGAPDEAGFWRVNDNGILVGEGGNPVRFKDQRAAAQWAAKNGQGGYFDQVSGRTNTTDTMLRARDRYYADRGGPRAAQGEQRAPGGPDGAAPVARALAAPAETRGAPARRAGSEPDGASERGPIPQRTNKRLSAPLKDDNPAIKSSENVKNRTSSEGAEAEARGAPEAAEPQPKSKPKSASKAYMEEVKRAQANAPRDGVTERVSLGEMIAESSPAGRNAAGEALYDNPRGRFRVRTDSPSSRPAGYPDFGGDLAPRPDTKGSTALYSNPLGQMLSMLFDGPGWKRNLDGMTDLASKLNKGRGRPDGQSTLGALVRWANLSSDGEQRAILKKNPSKTFKETLDKLFANSGDGAGQGATLDEAMTMRIQSQARAIQSVADAITAGKHDEAMIIRMVENPSARRGAMGKIADDIEKLMKESAGYLKDAGVEIGTVRNYFPRAFDKDIIAKNRQGFIDDVSKAYRLDGLAKNKVEADAMAEALWMNQMFGGGHAPGQPARAGLGDPFHSRVFSPKTDKLLAQYRQDGIGGVLSSYAARAARRAEIARRFGDNWSGWSDIEAAIKKEGAGGVLEGLRGHAERVAGIHNRNVKHEFQAASSWVRSFTTLQLLSRVVFSSVAEPLAAAAQTGNLLDGYRSLGTTVRQLFRGAKGSQAELRELAEDVGVVMSEGASSMMAARWSGGDPVGKLESTILSQFFRGIGMEQYTNASRVGAMRTGMVFASRLAKEHATDPKRASFFLKDLGVPEAVIPEFVKLMNKLGRNMPTADDLAKAGEAGAALRTVMMRSADRTIQRPSTATRPAWASHPFGAIIFQLRAFGYAFGKNVMLRPERIRQATKRGELGKGEAGKAYFALAAGALLPLFAAHTASSELRSRITNPERNERETTALKLERGASYTGFLGGYDPLFQLVSGARYDTKLVDVAAGPFIGTVGSMADSIVQAVGNNNPNTNSGERRAMRDLWRVVAEPALQAALTPMPAGQQTTFLVQVVNALTRSAGVRSIEAPVVDAVAGPAKERKPTPVEGGVEALWKSIERNLFGAAAMERRSRPTRAKRPERPSRQ